MRWRRPASVTLGLLAAVGCGSGSRQGAAAGDGAPPRLDGGDAAGEAGALAHPFVGRRAYVVTATFDPPLRGVPLPDSHRFTLVLDGDADKAIVSSLDGFGQVPFTTADGRTFRLAGLFAFAFRVACSSNVEYTAMNVTISPEGHVTGAASGRATGAFTDVLTGGDVSALIDGVPDTEPPTLSARADGDPGNPFVPFTLVASEALPPGTKPVLTSSHGDRIELQPSLSGDAFPGTVGFGSPTQLLRYDETYAVDGAQLVDFAGNAGTTSFTFTTRAAPPLVAEDGFESAEGPTLGGARVIAAPAYPAIAGAKSLLVPAVSQTGPAAVTTPLTLRLRVQPGESVIRFSYRGVGATPNDVPRVSFQGGVVGKRIEIPPPRASRTATQVVLPDGSALFVSPIDLMEIAVPVPADEVILAVVTPQLGSCGGGALPVPSSQGVIVDDVRVEAP